MLVLVLNQITARNTYTHVKYELWVSACTLDNQLRWGGSRGDWHCECNRKRVSCVCFKAQPKFILDNCHTLTCVTCIRNEQHFKSQQNERNCPLSGFCSLLLLGPSCTTGYRFILFGRYHFLSWKFLAFCLVSRINPTAAEQQISETTTKVQVTFLYCCILEKYQPKATALFSRLEKRCCKGTQDGR